MPKIDDYDPEKDKEPPLTAGTLGGAPGPSAAAPAAAVNRGVPAGQANFSSYFSANQGAAEKQAGALAGGLEAAGSKVQGDLAGRQKGFGAGMDAGTPDWMRPPGAPTPAAMAGNRGLGMAASSPAPGTVRGTALSSQPIAPIQTGDFNGLSGAPQKGDTSGTGAIGLGEAASRAGATYGGPKDLSSGAGWSDLVSAATKAQTAAGQTGSEGGLQALGQQAQKDAGASGYSQGASKFDAGLTQAADGGRFAALRQRFGGLSGQLTDADKLAASKAGDRGAAVAGQAAGYAGEVAGYKDPTRPQGGPGGPIDPNAPAPVDPLVAGRTAAANDDPDHDQWAKDWGSKPDPVWQSLTPSDLNGIAQAKKTMSPQDYQEFMRQLKTRLKRGGK